MKCPHCGEDSFSSDWILDDGEGNLVSIEEVDYRDGGIDFSDFEAATCPNCCVAVHMDMFLLHNS